MVHRCISLLAIQKPEDMSSFCKFISSTIVFTLLLLGPISSRAVALHPDHPTQNTVSSWCSLTPFPEPCLYHLSQQVHDNAPQNKPDFLRLLIETALHTSVDASRNALSLGHMCRDLKEKTAWSDCLELYEMTTQHLNRTVTKSQREDDAQTWLSSALTHLETCKNGFSELGASLAPILPMMERGNTSHLIRNALAMNNNHKNYTFSSWVKRKQLLAYSSVNAADIVVAKDGSGKHNTIKEAVTAAGARSSTSTRMVIYVKQGVYNENVEIRSSSIMLMGDGIGKTIITGSRSVHAGYTTFRSATFAVTGSKFIARDITFRNTAGPLKHQAVALRSGADLSVFYKCSFEGYQDTLYVFSNRQFYKECEIYGTVDFIFGNAAATLQDCNIKPRYPPHGTNTLTAQDRTDPNQNTGISIHNCRVTPASSLIGKSRYVRTFLGRPWKMYSRTVFMKTYLDNIIDPVGWMQWSGSFALDTLYYGEYLNTGPGSSTSRRVKWKGYHVIASSVVASKFTVRNFISGDSWLPKTGIPYTSAL